MLMAAIPRGPIAAGGRSHGGSNVCSAWQRVTGGVQHVPMGFGQVSASVQHRVHAVGGEDALGPVQQGLGVRVADPFAHRRTRRPKHALDHEPHKRSYGRDDDLKPRGTGDATLPGAPKLSMRCQPAGQIRRIGEVEQRLTQCLQVFHRQVGNARFVGLRHVTDTPLQQSQHQTRLALTAARLS